MVSNQTTAVNQTYVRSTAPDSVLSSNKFDENVNKKGKTRQNDMSV